MIGKPILFTLPIPAPLPTFVGAEKGQFGPSASVDQLVHDINLLIRCSNIAYKLVFWSGGAGTAELQLLGGVIGNIELQLHPHDQIGKGAVAP